MRKCRKLYKFNVPLLQLLDGLFMSASRLNLKPWFISIPFCLALLITDLSMPLTAKEGLVAGWVEPVVLAPFGVNLRAKLDSGALNSSLNAPDLKIIQRDKLDYAQFTLKGYKKRVVNMELPVIRYARIKRHNGVSQKRPVVMLQICLANQLITAEVNLIDRSLFQFQLLLGRTMLAGRVLIDSAQKKLTTPDCPN